MEYKNSSTATAKLSLFYHGVQNASSQAQVTISTEALERKEMG